MVKHIGNLIITLEKELQKEVEKQIDTIEQEYK
jgi:hypothetical protein